LSLDALAATASKKRAGYIEYMKVAVFYFNVGLQKIWFEYRVGFVLYSSSGKKKVKLSL
jgi:hypothetical protein